MSRGETYGLGNIARTPYMQYVDLSLIEDKVFKMVETGDITAAGIVSSIEDLALREADYMDDLANSCHVEDDDEALSEIEQSIFKRNELSISSQGLVSKLAPTSSRVKVISMTGRLSQHGKTLSKQTYRNTEAWENETILHPTKGHPGLLYQQFWEIDFGGPFYINAYKQGSRGGVLVYTDEFTVGVFDIKDFTNNWTDLTGNI